MWGRGEYGRLGLGDDCADRQRPVELTLGSWGGDPRPPRIIDAALGGTHSCLLDESGVVYSFGRNSLGRLGRVRFYLFLFPYLFYLHMGNCTDVVFCFTLLQVAHGKWSGEPAPVNFPPPPGGGAWRGTSVAAGGRHTLVTARKVSRVQVEKEEAARARETGSRPRSPLMSQSPSRRTSISTQ